MATTKTAGSYSGGMPAQAWANLVMKGRDGLQRNARRLHDAFKKIRDFVEKSPYLDYYGTPHGVTVGMISNKFDVFKLVDAIKERGWSLTCNMHSVQMVVGERQADVIDEFLTDLQWACEE